MPQVTVLVKPVSGRCDYACSYCFYRDVSLRRTTPDMGTMSGRTAEALIERAFEYAEGKCSFVFQGGEPTLAGLDFFRQFVLKARELAQPGLELDFSLQTNGSTMNREWADFLREEGFLTGLSLDGPRLLHDRHRVSASGAATFRRTMEAASILREARAPFNVLCVVDTTAAANASLLYDFFARNSFAWIQFIPCLPPFGSSAAEPPLSSDAWAAFLKTTFDLWFSDIQYGREIHVRYFDNLVRMAMGSGPDTCSMLGTCTPYFTVEADGSVYPCDFYAVDEWRLGEVQGDSFASIAKSKEFRRFIDESRRIVDKCRDCFAYPLCRGGCRRDREPFEAGLPALNRHCPAYKEFFSYAGERIIGLAAHLNDESARANS